MSLCKVGSLFGRVEMETILSHTLHENSNLYDLVIGASLSEPHTYMKYSKFVCIYIYIYIYIVRRAVYFYLMLQKWLRLANSALLAAGINTVHLIWFHI